MKGNKWKQLRKDGRKEGCPTTYTYRRSKQYIVVIVVGVGGVVRLEYVYL